MRHCIYLHGFASGPTSEKAVFFKEKLEAIGYAVDVPDLNGSSFTHMTLSSQLELVSESMQKAKGASELLLFGSSMGGLLSVLAAQKHTKIDRLVLLAPGFGLSRRWLEWLGTDGVEKWQQEGTVEVMHYGTNQNEQLAYGFIEDANRYQTDELKVSVPTLIIHGKGDETVPYAESVRFAQLNPEQATLHLLEADHSLLDHLPHMWKLTSEFLQLPIAGAV